MPSTDAELSDDERFDDIARWQADAAEVLGLQGTELVAALSPGAGFPAVLEALAERIDEHHRHDPSPRPRRVRVMDLGAGLGGATAWLAAATEARVVGVEPATGSLEGAHRLFGGLDIRRGSASDTGADDVSADVVVAVGVTSLLDELDPLFAEARRLLRPGGFLGIVDMFLADGEVEVDGRNTLRSVAETTRLARAAGFDTELTPAVRDDSGEHVELIPASAGPLVVATDADPAIEWARAAERLAAEVVAGHPDSPAVDAWLADRRKLAGWIDAGHVIAACLTFSPVEDAGPRFAASKLLRVYLQDHHAASSAGVRRVRRLADAERDGDDGAALSRIATEIAEDQESLERVMRTLGVSPQALKEVSAKGAEKVGLLKRNGTLVHRSPLTTLVELEAMLVAVRGKLAGWTSLRAALHDDHLGGLDLDELVERSERHLAELAAIHVRRAADVLAVE